MTTGKASLSRVTFKNTILLLFGGLIISVPVLLISGPSFSQDQEQTNQDSESEDVPPAFDLESFISPEQTTLEEPKEELAPMVEETQAEQEENEALFAEPTDALPAVNTTRVRIKTEGFDYTGNNTATAEFDNYQDGPEKKSSEELAEEIRREAYDAALTGLFPLRPEDIRRLLKEYDETRRAVEEPVGGVPIPKVVVTTVSLDPGVPPLELKTAVGHITSLNILDVTGAPWPVQDISWAGDFEIIEPEEGGHIIRITPMANSAYGNMSIRLLTLKTPITIMLKTGRDEVQYRVDARIPEYGPFAKAPLIEGANDLVAGNSLLMSILDGTPPESAERLEVSGVDGRTTAFKISSKTYVRTPLTLLSPGWDQSVSSADGMKVYSLNETPVVLLSDKGRFMRASLKPGKDLFDE